MANVANRVKPPVTTFFALSPFFLSMAILPVFTNCSMFIQLFVSLFVCWLVLCLGAAASHCVLLSTTIFNKYAELTTKRTLAY